MSWEESKPKYHLCPCGNGQYAVIYCSDDWGRSDERWEMHCPNCKETYRLYRYYTNRKGISERHYGWVTTDKLRQLKSIINQIKLEEDELQKYVERNFKEKWNRHFTGKTKKEIWSALTRNGQMYPQLTTFYKHVRQNGISSILERYMKYPEVRVAIRILGINDSTLEKKINILEKLEEDAEQQKIEVLQHCIV